MNCPHCQEELPGNYAGGSCPSCAQDLPAQAEAKPPEPPARNKASCWLVFWLAFFGTPILTFVIVSTRAGAGILFLPVLGALIAGFSLAKVYTKTPGTFIAAGILMSLGVMAIYVGIIFVGCLVIMGHGSGI